MGCYLSTILSSNIEDYTSTIEKYAKSTVERIPKYGNGRSVFLKDKNNNLWKLRRERNIAELMAVYHNNMRVFLLPSNNFVLRPSYVWHINNRTVLIKMPHADTDLFDFHKRGATFEDIDRAFRDVAASIEWLHNHGIAHRDIKPENVVLHKDRFKLIDFDFSSPMEEHVQCGTYNFMCPPSLVKDWNCSASDASRRSDVYSYGKLILSTLWDYFKFAPIEQRKRLWDMFHCDHLTESLMSVDPTKQQWIDLAVQCCHRKPPCKIPLLPTAAVSTLITKDIVTDTTMIQVVNADTVLA